MLLIPSLSSRIAIFIKHIRYTTIPPDFENTKSVKDAEHAISTYLICCSYMRFKMSASSALVLFSTRVHSRMLFACVMGGSHWSYPIMQCVCTHAAFFCRNCPTRGPPFWHNVFCYFTLILSDVCADVCTETTMHLLLGEALTYAAANTKDGAWLLGFRAVTSKMLKYLIPMLWVHMQSYIKFK